MKMEDLKVGDIVHLKGDDSPLYITEIYDDGVIDAIEITDEYDKHRYVRHFSKFEAIESNSNKSKLNG